MPKAQAASKLADNGGLRSTRGSMSVENCSHEPGRSLEAKRGRKSKRRHPQEAKNREGRATPRWLAFEAGLGWVMERANMSVSDSTYEDWHRRSLHVRVAGKDWLQRQRPAAELPRGKIEKIKQWVRTRCFDDTANRRVASHEFVFRCKSLANRTRMDRFAVEMQLVHWVEFARDRRTYIGKSKPGAGLGLFAATRISPDTVIASGDLDKDVWWGSSELQVETEHGKIECGALGPVSMVNAGCDTCANARLVLMPCGKRVELRAGAPDWEHTIDRNLEILINHRPLPGVKWLCPRCNVRILA